MDLEYNNLVYNNFIDVNSISFRIMKHLKDNNDNIFKLLKYNDVKALEEEITSEEKIQMLPPYNLGEGYNDDTKVYLDENIDIVENKIGSQIRIFIEDINPINNIISSVEVGILVLVHNDLHMLNGYKNRKMVLAQEIMASLNGVYLTGIGSINVKRCTRTRESNEYTGYLISLTQMIAGG